MLKIEETHNDEILTIRFSSADNKNALTSDTIDQLRAVLRQKSANKRAILFNSDIEGYFCLGMDLNFLTERLASPQTTHTEVMNNIHHYALFLQELLDLPCLVMAEVDGLTVGGGVDILGGCDIVLASDSAAFSIAQLRNRIFPLTTSAMIIPLIGKNAFLYWCLSGQNYTSKRLQELGVVNQVLPSAVLRERAEQFITQLCAYDKDILSLGVRSIRQSQRMKQAEYLTYLSSQLTHNCLMQKA